MSYRNRAQLLRGPWSNNIFEDEFTFLYRRRASGATINKLKFWKIKKQLKSCNNLQRGCRKERVININIILYSQTPPIGKSPCSSMFFNREQIIGDSTCAQIKES